ncbi:MAG: CHRD domain-containing protein [Pseudomonadota bacterium]
MNSRSTLQTFAALLTVIGGITLAADMTVTLSGTQEMPAVTTDAQGASSIKIAADKSVTGSVKTTGIVGTMAHVHLAAKGQNGPPIITLEKTSATEWSIPAGAKLTDEQYTAYKAGNLYVNVHSDAHKSGEIRAQLVP